MISPKVVLFSQFTTMSFSSLPKKTNTNNECVVIDLKDSKQIPFLTYSTHRSTLLQLKNQILNVIQSIPVHNSHV